MRYLKLFEQFKGEINFHDGPDEDKPGNNLFVAFDKGEQYTIQGQTHGGLSHAIKHFSEFKPEEFDHIINDAINYVRNCGNVYLKKVDTGEIIDSGDSAKSKLNSNTMINTFDFINDKIKNKQKLSEEEVEIKNKFLLDLNKRYEDIVRIYLDGAIDVEGKSDEEILRLIKVGNKIKFDAKYKNISYDYVLDTSTSGLLVGKGKYISTLFRIDKRGNDLGKIANYFSRGVQIDNPNLRKALGIKSTNESISNEESKILSFCKEWGIRNPTTNEGGEVDVLSGDVEILSRWSKDELPLDKLPIKFGTVEGDFKAFDLFSDLEGCPHTVGGAFVCKNNDITSLKGCPRHVGDRCLLLNNLRLTSLDGLPQFIGKGGLVVWNSYRLWDVRALKDVHFEDTSVMRYQHFEGTVAKPLIELFMMGGEKDFSVFLDSLIYNYIRNPLPMSNTPSINLFRFKEALEDAEISHSDDSYGKITFYNRRFNIMHAQKDNFIGWDYVNDEGQKVDFHGHPIS